VNRPVLFIYLLAIYILFQFGWWAYLLIELNNEVCRNQIEYVNIKQLTAEERDREIKLLEERISARHWMVYGEGSVFLILLVWGTAIMLNAYKKEILLARQQKNFLLSITHEFKSPLASIKLYLQTLLRHDLDKNKEKSFISSAINDTERLNNLVENALLANLIDHKGYSFSKEDVNFSALIKIMAQKFQQIPGHENISVQIEDGLYIYADKNALTILISNLLENAWKYSPEDKSLSVKVYSSGFKVILEIGDHGVGIPDKEKHKIFNKFYRVGNEETRRTKGTGLGLFICKYIIDKHNGKIHVSDNKPHGTIVIVEFPSIAS
jgi:two-component system, OmpR family, phosphate regulon sensor histidine kinase PhoR